MTLVGNTDSVQDHLSSPSISVVSLQGESPQNDIM
jgi:hypothetical protein